MRKTIVLLAIILFASTKCFALEIDSFTQDVQDKVGEGAPAGEVLSVANDLTAGQLFTFIETIPPIIEQTDNAFDFNQGNPYVAFNGAATVINIDVISDVRINWGDNYRSNGLSGDYFVIVPNKRIRFASPEEIAAGNAIEFPNYNDINWAEPVGTLIHLPKDYSAWIVYGLLRFTAAGADTNNQTFNAITAALANYDQNANGAYGITVYDNAVQVNKGSPVIRSGWMITVDTMIYSEADYIALMTALNADPELSIVEDRIVDPWNGLRVSHVTRWKKQ